MSPAAIEIFHNILTKQMIGFEFGSGSSTLFLAARVQQLISLEHDRTWYDSIHAKLQIKTTNVEYFLVEPENNEHKKEKYPATAYTNIIHAPAPATCYKLYYSFIDKYPDEHFDFVIVDGRARTECSLHAISKIKKGGFLVLDNAERYRYKTVHDELTGWKKVFTTTGLTDTVFWFKE